MEEVERSVVVTFSGNAVILVVVDVELKTSRSTTPDPGFPV